MTLRGGKSVMLTRRSSRCPRSLENPHRTRVPTFPQQRLRRRTNLSKLQNPPKSQGLTDSCAEPKFDASQLHEEPVGIRWHFQTLTVGFDQHLQVVFGFEPSPTSVERYSQTSQVKNSPLKFGFSKRSTVSRATSYVPRPPPLPAARALTNTLQSGSSQTNKSLDGLPGYSTAGRDSTLFAAIVTCVLFSMGRG